MNGLAALLTSVLGYLIGSVSFSRLVARRVVPDRELGMLDLGGWSEGAGFTIRTVSATSVAAAAGPGSGCLTALLDIAKAFLPTLAARLLWPDQYVYLVVALAVMVGHNYPIWHGFRGGRGISTLIGALLVVDPLAIPVTILVSEALGILVLRDVLIAHMGWVFLLPLYFLAWGAPWQVIVFSLAAIVIRWAPAADEVRQYFALRRAGELRTEAFHEFIETTHIGFIHKYARRWGLVRYRYDREG